MTANEIIALAKEEFKNAEELPRRVADRLTDEGFDKDAVESALGYAYEYAHYVKETDAWPDEAIDFGIGKERDRIADRRRYDEMSEEDYRLAIDELVPSAEMREHLYTHRLSCGTFHDLAVAAAVPLEVKEKYASTEDRLEIRRAIDALEAKPGELFYLFDAWYDDDIGGEQTYGNAPFTSIDKVLSSIRVEASFYDDGDSFYENCYYIVQKWALDENGDYSKQYTYWFVREVPMYFRNDSSEINRHLEPGRLRFSFGAHCLGLPAPFKVGEIVTVDCTPFAPRVRGVVIENSDDPTVGFPIIYRDPFTRVWRMCDLRQGLWLEGIVSDDKPMISPMLRLSRCDGKLRPGGVLSLVRDYLDGDEAKGHALWDEINTCTDKHADDAELLALVAEIRAANDQAAPEILWRFAPDDWCVSDDDDFEEPDEDADAAGGGTDDFDPNDLPF